MVRKFLLGFQVAFNTRKITSTSWYQNIYFIMQNPIVAAENAIICFTSCFWCLEKGKLISDCHVVKYLLNTYNTYATGKLWLKPTWTSLSNSCWISLSCRIPKCFRNALWFRTMHDKHWLNQSITKDICTSTRQSMRLYWKNMSIALQDNCWHALSLKHLKSGSSSP